MLRSRKGITLIETLIVAALIGLVLPVLGSFIWRSFEFNRHAVGSIINQQSARRMVDKLKAEIREAGPGVGNEYPLAICTADQIMYYADADLDGQADRVRYYLQGSQLRRGVTRPVGHSYPENGEETVVLINNMLNTAEQPLFAYYNRHFTGSQNNLAQPVSCPEVRAVRITVIFDAVIDINPGPQTVNTVVQLRNLKNNY